MGRNQTASKEGEMEQGVLQALLEAVGLARFNDILAKNRNNWGALTITALVIAGGIFVALLQFLIKFKDLLSSTVSPLFTAFWFTLLFLLVTLHFLWEPWPQRRLRLYAVPLWVGWAAVAVWLMSGMIGVSIPGIPGLEEIVKIRETPAPTAQPVDKPDVHWMLFDDQEEFGTWEFGSTPDGALPAGVMESEELEREECDEGTACIVLGDPREYPAGLETVPVARAWATWTPPPGGIPSCVLGTRLHLVFRWRMITYDVLQDNLGRQGDYFEVVFVREGSDGSDDEVIATNFGREGNPATGTSQSRHDMDWYDEGEYQLAVVELTPFTTGDTASGEIVAVRFLTANVDFGGDPDYDLYNTYTLLDDVYLSCLHR